MASRSALCPASVNLVVAVLSVMLPHCVMLPHWLGRLGEARLLQTGLQLLQTIEMDQALPRMVG